MAKVNFLEHPQDFRVALLGALGFGTEMIAGETGFSPGQISYRLKAAGVSRADYRTGKSPMSKLAYNLAHDAVAARLERTRAIRQLPPRAVNGG